MANGDEELDQQDGQGAGELEAPEVDEHDQQGGDEFAAHDQHLGELIKRGEQAGYGAQTATLKRVRKALRGTRAQIQAAEERGRQRALEEFRNGDGQAAVQAIRAQVERELTEQTSRERSLARLGLPADSPLRALFSDVQGDHREYERRADQLRSQGISWGQQDPLVRRFAEERLRVAQAQTQAALQNGGPVSAAPTPDIPVAAQEAAIRASVESMAAAQAGAQPVGADSLEDEIRRADPDRLGQAGVEDLAARFNREMDALSRARQGLW